MRFRDRTDAGRQLAACLADYVNRPDVIVLGLPRGGVVVAAEVASTLNAPLDVWLVRKLGVPGQPELAMGAVAPGGVEIHNDDLVHALQIPPAAIHEVAARERAELERRASAYRGSRAAPSLHDKRAILVDDGLATGATMEAAVAAARQLHPREVVVAVPVGARETVERIGRVADRTVVLEAPAEFRAVGHWYDDFTQTTDDEVRRLVGGHS
jgi:predicted phosphoribosyltransferase